jgi:hypothetical protein
MACETETVEVTYYVEVEFATSSEPSQFGKVSTKAAAEALLLTLAGRTDVKKAIIVKEAVL